MRPHIESAFIIETTTACDNRCLYCYNDPRDERHVDTHLPVDKLEHIVSQFQKGTVFESVALSGGEPYLHPQLDKIAATFVDAGYNVSVVTNGNRLLTGMTGNLLDAGVDFIEVTVPSHVPEHYALLTGSPHLQKVIQGIKFLLDCGVTVVAVVIVTAHNVDTVIDTFAYLRDIGVKEVMVNRVNASRSNQACFESLLPTIEELGVLYGAIDEFIENNPDMKIYFSVPMPLCVIDYRKYKNLSFGRCKAVCSMPYLAMDPEGNVRICNHSAEKLGNIFRQDLLTILENPYCTHFMEACPELCRDCSDYQECGAGCRAAAEVCYGDINRAEPVLVHYEKE